MERTSAQVTDNHDHDRRAPGPLDPSDLPVPDRVDAWPLELALRPSQVRAAAADTALMIPAAAALSSSYKDLAVPVAIMAERVTKLPVSRRSPLRFISCSEEASSFASRGQAIWCIIRKAYA